jgi:uncharacterized membrane protein YkoI
MPTNRSEFMKTILSISLLCMTLSLAASLRAANEDVQPQNLLPPAAERAREREPRISRDQASDIARETVPGGRVLNIRRDDDEDWRVRMDQEGRVSDVIVDAESGRVSRPDSE